MLAIFILLLGLIIFILAAMNWGYESSDGPESKEWERREQSTWTKVNSSGQASCQQ